MKLEKISKEIFKIFQRNNWTWGNGGPHSPKDIESLIIDLMESAIIYSKKDTSNPMWVSSGRIMVSIFKHNTGKVTTDIYIDSGWTMDADEMMVNML